MDLGAPVGGGALGGFTEPEHRGQRRNAQPADVLAQEKRAVDVHDHALCTVDLETVGAADTGAVEPRVEGHGVCVLVLWRLEPDMGEVGEFFGLAGLCHIQGNRPCRQAVLVQLADGPEVRRAKKGHPVVLLPRQPGLVAQAAFLDTKAGEPAVTGQGMGRAVARHIKVRRVVDDLAGDAVVQHIQPDGRAKKRPQVKECHRELAGAFGEQGVLGFEADLAMGGVVESRQQRGRCGAGVGVGFQGIGLCLFDQAFEGKSTGRVGCIGRQGAPAQWHEQGAQ